MLMSYEAIHQEEWNDYSDLTVGEILRRTRMHYGQSLEQVEFALRIRASQLHALEVGDVSQLPGRVYAIGFVRTYAEYLGLDGDRMVHLFKNQSVGNKNKADLSFPTISKESQIPSAPFIAGGMIGAILLVIAWIIFFARPMQQVDDIPTLSVDPDQSITAAPPIGLEKTIEDTAEGEEEAEEPKSILLPAPAQTGVVIKTTQSSWVEIRDANGKVVLSQILQEGDEYTIPASEGYKMTTGNAGGLSISVNGIDIQPIGKPAQVRRNVSLSPEDLLSRP